MKLIHKVHRINCPRTSTYSLNGSFGEPAAGFRKARFEREGAVKSFAIKRRGVWGEGAGRGKAPWDFLAMLVAQSVPKNDCWSVCFHVSFKRVVGSVFGILFEFVGVVGGFFSVVFSEILFFITKSADWFFIQYIVLT